MAFSTLTNTKTIMQLGPNRSILGTIIRPDPVLLERKGGSNGQVTFNSLRPGAGELLQPQFQHEQDLFCNWMLDEEPLPRGNGPLVEHNLTSSQKRKKSLKDKFKTAFGENGQGAQGSHEKVRSRKEKRLKKFLENNQNVGVIA